MFITKKILALAIIATFLAAIPLAMIPKNDDLMLITYETKYDPNYVKPDGHPPSAKTSADYKIIYKGYTAQTPLNWVVYPNNPDGLSITFVSDAITKSLDEWQTATTVQLANTITTKSASATGTVALNGEDAIMFGNYKQDGVIAVTYIWISRVARQIVECDIVFDIDFTWGDGASYPALMDLQNIATHELGHTYNLNDIYDSSKSYLTMYGYSTEGDIAKRTIEAGDAAGIVAIYGP